MKKPPVVFSEHRWYGMFNGQVTFDETSQETAHHTKIHGVKYKKS
jgi:hypothetical protein